MFFFFVIFPLCLVKQEKRNKIINVCVCVLQEGCLRVDVALRVEFYRGMSDATFCGVVLYFNSDVVR